MRVKTSDGKLGTLTGVKAGKAVGVKLDEGLTKYYPESSLKKVAGDETEIKVEVVPAIDRLEEYMADCKRLQDVQDKNVGLEPYQRQLYQDLLTEAEKDLKDKWGL